MSNVIECDGCEDKIVGDEHGEWKRQYKYRFDIPTENEREFEVKNYTICHECILKIIDFIEEDTNYSEKRVGKAGLENSVYSLEQHSKRLQDIADQLKEL